MSRVLLFGAMAFQFSCAGEATFYPTNYGDKVIENKATPEETSETAASLQIELSSRQSQNGIGSQDGFEFSEKDMSCSFGVELSIGLIDGVYGTSSNKRIDVGESCSQALSKIGSRLDMTGRAMQFQLKRGSEPDFSNTCGLTRQDSRGNDWGIVREFVPEGDSQDKTYLIIKNASNDTLFYSKFYFENVSLDSNFEDLAKVNLTGNRHLTYHRDQETVLLESSFQAEVTTKKGVKESWYISHAYTAPKELNKDDHIKETLAATRTDGKVLVKHEITFKSLGDSLIQVVKKDNEKARAAISAFTFSNADNSCRVVSVD